MYVGQVPELKSVRRNEIRNRDTVAVICKVLTKYRKGNHLSKNWAPGPEGLMFGIDTDEAKALLGMPNGCGVAWLLIQHKDEEQLGWKTVRSVTLY